LTTDVKSLSSLKGLTTPEELEALCW